MTGCQSWGGCAKLVGEEQEKGSASLCLFYGPVLSVGAAAGERVTMETT